MRYDTYERRPAERSTTAGARQARVATALSLAIALAITLLALFGDRI